MAEFRSKVRKNVPKVELQSIITLIAGGYKTGKTRLWKEVTEQHYATSDEAMLMAFEDGYETWELDNVVPLHEEGTDRDLWKVWEFFKKEVVPGLVQEAKSGRIVKLIGVDTADRALDACAAWIINDRNKKYAKTFTSIQDISESTNGKENGWTALSEELRKPFDTLKQAGYGLFYISWVKEKETTLHNGSKYNSLQLMMSSTGKKVFESQASLICCLFNETTVIDKNGKILEENITDKKGKEKASNFHETQTMMYFRPSEFIEIAGGRYTELPDKVEYSAENFLKVFENAVNGQLKKTNKSLEQIKVDQENERQDKADELADKFDNNTTEIMAKIDDIVGKMTKEQKIKSAVQFEKSFGKKNYKQEEGNIENLKKALDIVNSVVSE
jgi:hypothetical protein